MWMHTFLARLHTAGAISFSRRRSRGSAAAAATVILSTTVVPPTPVDLSAAKNLTDTVKADLPASVRGRARRRSLFV